MHRLVIDSVMKYYGSKSVLSDIFIECNTGDIVGLAGYNGMGKSTLLKVIFGIESALNKHIKVNGKIYTKPDGTICYLPQEHFLPMGVKVGALIKILFPATNVLLYNDSLLLKIWNTKIADLSGGESRYLEVKIMLNMSCNFLLLDEPFNKLSPLWVEQLMAEIISQSKAKGIIIADHRNEVSAITTKDYFLNKGKLKAITKDELKEIGF